MRASPHSHMINGDLLPTAACLLLERGASDTALCLAIRKLDLGLAASISRREQISAATATGDALQRQVAAESHARLPVATRMRKTDGKNALHFALERLHDLLAPTAHLPLANVAVSQVWNVISQVNEFVFDCVGDDPEVDVVLRIRPLTRQPIACCFYEGTNGSLNRTKRGEMCRRA